VGRKNGQLARGRGDASEGAKVASEQSSRAGPRGKKKRLEWQQVCEERREKTPTGGVYKLPTGETRELGIEDRVG